MGVSANAAVATRNALGDLGRVASCRTWRALLLGGALWLACTAGAVWGQGQDTVVKLDPARTTIDFTLGAVLHTVHGSFRLKNGEIRFDAATGKASGEVVVEASSGGTENSSRDEKMQQEVLESQKYPGIVFTPKLVHGSIVPQGTSEVQVTGTFRLHGQNHDVTLTFLVVRSSGNEITASTHFGIPYVSWGLKDPSTFVLRVDKLVNLEVAAKGQIETVAAR